MAQSPDAIVLGRLFEEFAATEYPDEPEDDVFEKFAVGHILKPREISPDELEAGIVDGGGDGGIDSFFVFVNGALIDVDDPLLDSTSGAIKTLAVNPEVEIFAVQSKNKDKWEEVAWEHLLSTLPNVLDLNKADADLEKLYNPSLVERTGIYRRLTLALATKFPRISFRATYVARAPEEHLTGMIEARAAQVEAAVKGLLTAGAVVLTEHVGIAGLYRLAGTTYSHPANLKFRSLLREEQNSFLGVATIEDYLSFVRDDAGGLREELFDSNVRDFEGDNVVNEAIGQTLSADDGTEFWWQNNGITVLADNVDSPLNSLTVSRPLIVNGLQTSHVLHRAQIGHALDSARLKNGIVVRVIVSTDEEVRDRIIAGTNRQTQVPTPALFATRPNQIKIEKYLLTQGLYYERRKNRYKNQGKPAKARITMSLLAQAMIALNLSRPDDARARPSTLLTREAGYEMVFPDDLDLNGFLRAAQLLRGVEDFLRSADAKAILNDFTNARFYVLTGYAMLRLGTATPSKIRFDKNFNRLKTPAVESTLIEALTILSRTAKRFRATHPDVSTDSIYKNSEFRDRYFAALRRRIAKAPAKKVAKKTPAKKVAKKTPAKKVAKKAPAKKVAGKKT